MYISLNESLYRVLLSDTFGSWIIETHPPYKIQYCTNSGLKNANKVPEPEEIYKNRKKIENNFLSASQKRKYDMIANLVNDEKYIVEKKSLKSKCAEIAVSYQTTASRIEKAYRKYLATYSVWNKSTPRKKRRESDTVANFTWAIKNIYFSSRRISLRDTYDLMLLEKYMVDGQLLENTPSFWAFRRFFYEKGYDKSLSKSITRRGKMNFLNNQRILYGSSDNWRTKIGAFQMDATIADIYLVSRFNRKDVIGRPNIYIAVDTVTQLIAGVYVGFESGFSAVSACLVNALEDKVEFCHRYDLNIEPWQWPNKELPGEIITDQGSEFAGEKTNELCKHYGIICHAMPPFRPDRKGIVEMTFDLIQKRYKSLLRGKGVIEEDAQERWAVDYKKQAVLNIDEFTKIIVRCIVFLNSGRTLSNKQPSSEMIASKLPMIPARLWIWHQIQRNTDLISASKEEFYLFTLDRVKTTVQKKGISVHGLWYSQMNMDQKGYTIGQEVQVAYDKNDLSQIWIIKDNAYHAVPLAGTAVNFSTLSLEEYRLCRKNIAEIENKESDVSQAMKLQLLADIRDIAEKAAKETKQQAEQEYNLPLNDKGDDKE